MNPETQSQEENPRPGLLRLALAPVLTLLLLLSVLLALHHSGLLQGLKDPKSLQAWILDRGLWAPLAFVGVLALRPFTLVPSLLFSPVAFALFGPYLGTVYKVLGETTGATLAFLVARQGFRGSLGRVVGRRGEGALGVPGFQERLGGMLERRGFLAVLALRVNLLIPFDAVNYGLGLSRLRLRDFVGGTLVGIVPGTFFYVGASGAALEGEVGRALVLGGGLGVMVLVSVVLVRGGGGRGG